MSWRSRPRWFEETPRAWWARLALLPLSGLAWLYALGAWLHRRLATRGWRPARRLACGVVSVGNLVVGGSGKTPVTAWVAVELRRRGYKVAIASRGYGRRAGRPVEVVSDGRFVRAGVEEGGDEPLLLAGHAPGVPVLVGRDRGVAGLRAVAAFGCDVLVLDDGFQHHRLARDVDLVVFDGGGGLGNGRCLPRGPLREPLGALGAADAILVVDGPLPESDERRIRARAKRAPWFAAERRPVGLRPLAGGRSRPAAELQDREVGMLCGIARPASFRRTLESLGARVVAERTFADHHAYEPDDLEGLAAEAPRWVTTEKDAVKILPGWVGGAAVDVLVIELAVDDAETLGDWLEERLRAARRP